MDLAAENSELRRRLALSEEALRRREAIEVQHSLLLNLGDAVREQSDAEGKIEVAARLLGEHLHASRVLWGEYDWDRGVAHIFNGWFADGALPFPTVMQLADYRGEVLSHLRAGKTVRVDDVGRLSAEPGYAAIAEVGVQALVSLPLLVDGTLKVNLSIHPSTPGVITLATGVSSGRPRATARTTISRSVTIPWSRPLSITGSAPASSSAISRAAISIAISGTATRISRVMTSATLVIQPLRRLRAG